MPPVLLGGDIMTTSKEEKEARQKEREARERAFPVALGTCPNCGTVIRFDAGEEEKKCPAGPCPVTVYRKARL
jgi:hypothetical protein